MATLKPAETEESSVPTKLRAPGFGMPVNFYPEINFFEAQLNQELAEVPFPSILRGEDTDDGRTTLPLLTLREIDMLRVMNAITDKPGWDSKIFDPSITQKWSEETLSQQNLDISPRMMTWIIDELQHKAKLFQKTSMITIFNGDVVKSDTALSASFKHRLQVAVKPLEDVPDNKKDWHPGSNGQVLDLVHPSLFPLTFGRSRVLEEGTVPLEDCVSKSAAGVVVPVPPEDGAPLHNQWLRRRNPYSRKFQWLPCEVDISRSARVTSYINNLHPEWHPDLYDLVGEAIDAAIPLWDHSLSTLAEKKWKARITYKGAYGQVYKPEIGKFTAPRRGQPIINLRKQFAQQGLQVIVKLANIVLTPDKPDYPGGSWHIEGQLNEHICASALYYYSNENITSSELAFRQQSNPEDAQSVKYEQDDHAFLQEVFGCTNWQAAVQVVGGVKTNEGRLVVFPNILQHQVQPFGLDDRTKPGHRKILALFLVDPHFRILSTANVPPQQMDWWAERLLNDEGHTTTQTESSNFQVLPQELREMVFDHVKDDFPIGLEEAKKLREELMEERKEYQLLCDDVFKAQEFSLCEH